MTAMTHDSKTATIAKTAILTVPMGLLAIVRATDGLTDGVYT